MIMTLKQISQSKTILIMVIILGFFLRIIGLLYSKNLNFDEAVVWNLSHYKFIDLLLGNYFEYRFHPPLYYLLIHLMLKVSDTEIWLRVPTVISSILTTFIIYKIVAKIRSQKEALLAALLYATSYFHIYWSLEVRVYEILFLFSLIYLLTYLYACNYRNNKFWILNSLLGMFCVSLDYSFLWIFLAINTHYVITYLNIRKLSKHKSWLLANLSISFIFLHYFLTAGNLVLKSKEALSGWIPKPNFYSIISLFSEIIGIKPIPYDYFNNNLIWTIITTALVILSLLLTKNLLKLFKKTNLLFSLIAYLPVSLSFIISQFYPIFVSWNLFIISFGIIVLLVSSNYQKSYFIVMLLIAWLLINITSYISYLYIPSEENWMATSHFLKISAQKTEKVLFLPFYFNIPFSYYNKKYNIFSNKIIDHTTASNYEVLQKIQDYHNRQDNHCIIIRSNDITVQKYLKILILKKYPITNYENGVTVLCAWYYSVKSVIVG